MSNQTVLPVKFINAASAATNITSQVLQREYSDNVGFQFSWTGTPTGTLVIQGSINYNPNDGTGDWETMTLSPVLVAPAGAAGHTWGQITNTTMAYLRAVYTAASGAGTLSGWTAAKAI